MLQHLFFSAHFLCLVFLPLTTNTDTDTRECFRLNRTHDALNTLVPSTAACKYHFLRTEGQVKIVLNNEEVLCGLHTLYECTRRLARAIHKGLGENKCHLLLSDLPFCYEGVGLFIENKIIKIFFFCEELDCHTPRVMPSMFVLLTRVP